MNIRIKNYELCQNSSSPTRWDVIENVKRVKKENNETYESYNDLAFGMSLENALELVVAHELNKSKVIVTISEFLEAYIKEKSEIVKQIQSIINIKI